MIQETGLYSAVQPIHTYWSTKTYIASRKAQVCRRLLEEIVRISNLCHIQPNVANREGLLYQA